MHIHDLYFIHPEDLEKGDEKVKQENFGLDVTLLVLPTILVLNKTSITLQLKWIAHKTVIKIT